MYRDLARQFVMYSHLFRRHETQRLYDEAMRGEIFAIFYILYQKDEVTAGDIAREMDISSARVAAMLNNLQKKDLIKREKSSQDKRVTQVILTDEGIALAEKTKTKVLDQVTEMLELLGEEDAQHIIRIMGRLAKKLDL